MGEPLLISLKKYLDMPIDEVKIDDHQASHVNPPELLTALVESYRSALLAMGTSGVRACPAAGNELQQNLIKLENQLGGDVTLLMMKEIRQHVSNELHQWGEQAAAHSEDEATKVKEILIILGQTAASVGDRNQQHTKDLNQFTSRLSAISNLENLTQIRTSLVKHASELKAHVDKMERESTELVTRLQTKITTYETKLKEVEAVALRDSLTGVANRLNIEERIESRIALGQSFCVLVIDVNQLKKVNDTHGHLAGDSLLQQFAQELRSSFRSTDIVGRWGGDEFIIVMDCDTAGAEAQTERMQKWVFGEYTIRPGKGTGEVKIHVDAAVGLAAWRSGETAGSLIDRADAAMYAQKALMKK
jgi:diguanylate cyclase